MAGERHVIALDVPYVVAADPVPIGLRERLREGRCLLFLGAGASLSAKDSTGRRLPSWGGMVDELLTLLSHQRAQSPLVEEEIRVLKHPEAGELLALSEWIDSELNSTHLSKYLQDRLSGAHDSPVHEILSTKPFAGIITTNYDDLAEQYWRKAGRDPLVTTPHMSRAEIEVARRNLQNPGGSIIPIIKPHGTWSRPDTLVFGPRTYREIMFNNESFRQFMYELFHDYTILFVGFSFKDPNFHSLLQWVYTKAEGHVPTHYATMENRGEVFKRYMRKNFSVELLTYPVPPMDHSACETILNAL